MLRVISRTSPRFALPLLYPVHSFTSDLRNDRGVPLKNRFEVDETLVIGDDRLHKILGDKGATKFHLSNVPEKVNMQQLSDLFASNGIQYKRVVKVFGKPHAKIMFHSHEQARDMLRRLSQFCIDRKKIYINQAHDSRIKYVTPKVSDKRIEDVTTPWWDIPYPEQVEKKHEKAIDILSRTGKSAIKVNAEMMSNIAWVDALNTRAMDQDRYPPMCEFTGVEPAPIQIGYRNKISFTIGHNAVDQVTIGFVMGKFKEGIVHLGDPSGAVNSPVHPTALHLRQLYEEYLRSESKLPVFNRITQVGFWRGLEIRTFNSCENSLTFQVEPTAASEDVCTKVMTYSEMTVL